MILMGLFLFSSTFSHVVSQAGFAMAITTGFAQSDIMFGCRAMRLW